MPLRIPGSSPYSAQTMASKIVVLPEPVGPVIRKRPFLPSASKSMVCSPGYEPKAFRVSNIGRIQASSVAAAKPASARRRWSAVGDSPVE